MQVACLNPWPCGREVSRSISCSSVLPLPGQLDLDQPEIIDALHQALEGVQLHRLAEVAVRLELIAFQNIRLRFGGSQDHYGDRFQALIILDVSQNLAAIHFGQVEIQQDKIWTRGMGVGSLLPQKGHGLHTVGSDVQLNRHIGIAECLLRQPDITGAIFNLQNLWGYMLSSVGFHNFLSLPVEVPSDPYPLDRRANGTADSGSAVWAACALR